MIITLSKVAKQYTLLYILKLTKRTKSDNNVVEVATSAASVSNTKQQQQQ